MSTGAARTGLNRDVMSEDWAVRDHTRRIYYRPLEGASPDGRGLQHAQVVKGRLVDPETSWTTGGTVVRGRSKKGKFARKNFVAMSGKSDARIDPVPVRGDYTPFRVAYVHDGNRKTAKHVPMRRRCR